MNEKNAPILSIVIPVYNTSKYLRRCLSSIVIQDCSKVEIIIVNDGSTDSSLSICNEMVVGRGNFFVFSKTNGGLSSARNEGLNHAHGLYIWFVDSDDYVSPFSIQTIIRTLTNHKCDILKFGNARVTSNGKERKKIAYSSNTYDKEGVSAFLLSCVSGGMKDQERREMGIWSFCFKNSLLMNHRFESERQILCEDICFEFDVIPNAMSIFEIKDCLYYYCENTNSLTTSYNPNRFLLSMNLYNNLINKTEEAKLNKNEAINRITKLLIINVERCISQEATQKFRIAKKNISSIINNKNFQIAIRKTHWYYGKVSNKFLQLLIWRKRAGLLFIVFKIYRALFKKGK